MKKPFFVSLGLTLMALVAGGVVVLVQNHGVAQDRPRAEGRDGRERVEELPESSERYEIRRSERSTGDRGERGRAEYNRATGVAERRTAEDVLYEERREGEQREGEQRRAEYNRVTMFRERQNVEGMEEFRDTVQRLRRPGEEDSKEVLRQQVRELLRAQLDRDLEQREKSLREIEERAARLREQLEVRRANQEETLQLLMTIVENPSAGLGLPDPWMRVLLPSPGGAFGDAYGYVKRPRDEDLESLRSDADQPTAKRDAGRAVSAPELREEAIFDLRRDRVRSR